MLYIDCGIKFLNISIDRSIEKKTDATDGKEGIRGMGRLEGTREGGIFLPPGERGMNERGAYPYFILC